MNKFVAFTTSSIGKKVTMSLTGIFLMIFLVEHLVGNLLLFRNDAGAMYEAYGEFLVNNPVIRAVEIVLFLSIIAHALSGLIVWWQNKQARPEKYSLYRLKDNTPLASRTTLVTGSVVFFFLVVHLRTFFVPTRFSEGSVSSYHLIREAFANPWYVWFYLFALLLLGYHLRHGFQSAFQTLGLRNKQYTAALDAIAFLFWFVIPAGFASIPVYFFYFVKTV